MLRLTINLELLLLVLVIGSCLFETAYSRNKIRKNYKTNSKSPANTDPNSEPDNTKGDLLAVEPPRTKRGSRRREERERRRGKGDRKRSKKEKNILSTSMEAKIITERQYLKKDWCKSQPVHQSIRTITNCQGKIVNQFCYGQCNSFYIPKDIAIGADKEVVPDYFKSCSFCKPKKEEWISVRMRCKNIRKTKMPRFITKKVKRVKGCSCIAVPDLDVPSGKVKVINLEREKQASASTPSNPTTHS